MVQTKSIEGMNQGLKRKLRATLFRKLRIERDFCTNSSPGSLRFNTKIGSQDLHLIGQGYPLILLLQQPEKGSESCNRIDGAPRIGLHHGSNIGKCSLNERRIDPDLYLIQLRCL